WSATISVTWLMGYPVRKWQVSMGVSRDRDGVLVKANCSTKNTPVSGPRKRVRGGKSRPGKNRYARGDVMAQDTETGGVAISRKGPAAAVYTGSILQTQRRTRG